MKVASNRENPALANPNPDSESVWYVCQRCTNCCRWPGQVRLREPEISAIAAFLGLSEWDFIQRFTRLQISRQGLSLVEKTDGSCIFLEGKDCRIQPVKPQQCRDFPNGWNFPGWREVCHAIPGPRPPEV